MEQIPQGPSPVQTVAPTAINAPIDTQPSSKKNIKLWIGVIVGIVVISLGATFMFKETALFEGKTPPPPVTADTCSEATTKTKCESYPDYCDWTGIKCVSTGDEADASAKSDEEEGTVAETKTGADTAGDEEKTEEVATADTGTKADIAGAEEKTGEKTGTEKVEVALLNEYDEFKKACENLGPDGIWDGDAITCTYKDTAFKSLADLVTTTQPDTSGEDSDAEEKTEDKAKNGEGTPAESVIDEKTCTADSAHQWNAETNTCEKITAGVEVAILEEEDLPDQTSQQIQDLQNQIAQLQQELATTQANSANYDSLLRQIIALQQQIADMGGQQPTIVVNVPSATTDGRSVAPTECSNPSFTFDAARGVCVPPAEVVINIEEPIREVVNEEATDEEDASPNGDTEYDLGFGDSAEDADSETSNNTTINAGPVDNVVTPDTSAGVSTSGTTSAAATGTAYGTYIQGDTGPEVLLYPILIGAANGLYYLRRRKKRGQ